MRLIDVDEAIKQFDPNTWQGEMLITILKGLPTAYDVDGVLNQLDDAYNKSELGDYHKIVKRGGKS